jgi:undecaprenyl pyrophosphate phosphatase UppP
MRKKTCKTCARRIAAMNGYGRKKRKSKKRSRGMFGVGNVGTNWGNIEAFIVAIIAIKFFINVLKKYGFKMWGWYRIVLGIVFIVYYSYIK